MDGRKEGTKEEGMDVPHCPSRLNNPSRSTSDSTSGLQWVEPMVTTSPYKEE
jgi:hypothetical protein